MAKTPEQYAAKIKEAISDLAELGWNQRLLVPRLGVPPSSLSEMKRFGKGKRIDGVLTTMQKMVKDAELPPEGQPADPPGVKPERQIPKHSGGTGVLDDIRHADKLLEELERTLSNAEQNCLPLLRPGLKQALEQVRGLHKSLRIG